MGLARRTVGPMPRKGQTRFSTVCCQEGAHFRIARRTIPFSRLGRLKTFGIKGWFNLLLCIEME